MLNYLRERVLHSLIDGRILTAVPPSGDAAIALQDPLLAQELRSRVALVVDFVRSATSSAEREAVAAFADGSAKTVAAVLRMTTEVAGVSDCRRALLDLRQVLSSAPRPAPRVTMSLLTAPGCDAGVGDAVAGVGAWLRQLVIRQPSVVGEALARNYWDERLRLERVALMRGALESAKRTVWPPEVMHLMTIARAFDRIAYTRAYAIRFAAALTSEVEYVADVEAAERRVAAAASFLS